MYGPSAEGSLMEVFQNPNHPIPFGEKEKVGSFSYTCIFK